MVEMTPDPIPPEPAEAFAEAVLVYENWDCENPGRSSK